MSGCVHIVRLLIDSSFLFISKIFNPQNVKIHFTLSAVNCEHREDSMINILKDHFLQSYTYSVTFINKRNNFNGLTNLHSNLNNSTNRKGYEYFYTNMSMEGNYVQNISIDTVFSHNLFGESSRTGH